MLFQLLLPQRQIKNVLMYSHRRCQHWILELGTTCSLSISEPLAHTIMVFLFKPKPESP